MSSNHDTPTDCNASNRPAARDRVGADNAPARSGSRVGRRTFVKGIGATAVAGLITLPDHMGMYDVPDVVDSIRGSGDD